MSLLILRARRWESSPVSVLSRDSVPIRPATPVSGNLALTQLSSYSHGAFAVYPKAKGKPTIYPDKQIDATWFCSYDASGNLFAIAWDRYGKTILATLRKGGKAIETFELAEKFQNPGGLQWDGKYVAMGNRATRPFPSTLDRLVQ